jgi:hypothetical protein
VCVGARFEAPQEMNLHPDLCENTPLNELPNRVARNLVSKLNEKDRWIEIIEKINPFVDRYV